MIYYNVGGQWSKRDVIISAFYIRWKSVDLRSFQVLNKGSWVSVI